MNVLGLFSGIGGFELGLERADMKTVAFCENDKFCRQLLSTKWIGILIIESIQKLLQGLINGTLDIKPDLICGGDPCQKRSRGRGNHKSKHPDLSGYFLAVVGRLLPRWVVRENVPAPDVTWFIAALELLGYGVVTIELNARDFTAQSRRRQFIIGCYREDAARIKAALFEQERIEKSFKTCVQQKGATSMCITTHPKRYNADENYVVETGRGLRILTAEERERLQDFPTGWTNGFSFTRRCMMLGNAVPPPMVEFIGRAIMEIELNA